MFPKGRTGRLLLVAVLVLFAVGMGWRFRPLTAAERPLVGVWRFDHSQMNTFIMLTLGPDRTYSETVLIRTFPRGSWQVGRGFTGAWTCSGDRLWLRQRPLGPGGWSGIVQRCRQWLSGEPRWQEIPFEVGPDGRGEFPPKGGGPSVPFSRVLEPELLKLAADRVDETLPAESSLARRLNEVLPPAQ